ncbi:hypothetical protein ACIHAX_36595 [Nocardia sp. NPDC051929]|uniref:hypothetical protein n=1 Tax=unclassified Nocardia TaxID=2637762 RepID=UPI00343DDC1B
MLGFDGGEPIDGALQLLQTCFDVIAVIVVGCQVAIVLDIVRPAGSLLADDYSPIEDLQRWFEHDRTGSPAAVGDIAFIEAIALKGTADERLSSGTVIVALSHGERLESWWDNALGFLDDHNAHSD